MARTAVSTPRRPRKRQPNPVYNPAVQLSGRALKKAARQITDAAYAPKLAAVNQQIKSATTQGTALADNAQNYYRQIAEREAAGLARQRALGDILKSDVAAIGTATRGDFDAMQGAEAARQQSDTALRGGGLAGGSGDVVAGTIAGLRGRADTLQQSAASSAAAQAGSWESLQNMLSGATGLRGAESHDELLNRLANEQTRLREQKTTLKAAKGDDLTKNLVDLRQQAFENIVTQLGLDIKQADIQAGLKKAKVSAKVAQQRIKSSERENARDRTSREKIAGGAQATTQRGQDLSHTDRQAAIAARGDKPKAMPAAALQHRRAINNVASEVEDLTRQGYTRAEAVGIMRRRAKRAKQTLPDDVLSPALDLAFDGHVSGRNAQILRQAGLRIPKAWRRRPDGPQSRQTDAQMGYG